MKNPSWLLKLKQYEGSDLKKSITQIFTSILPYFAIMALMFYMVSNHYSYWLVLPLTMLASGFFMRIFIILHDCSHNSFFNSKRACSIFGNISGVITFTPFSDWKLAHSIHHSTVSKLEGRGIGDMWTMTVKEYNTSSKMTKFAYRLFRNPLVFLLLGPIALFFVFHRIPKNFTRKKEMINLSLTNVALIGIVVVAYFTIGLWNYAIVQLPVVYFAGVAGVWLFYIQHQYEDVYWSDIVNWDPIKAAMEGSSFYKLPAIFRWFSGNIGYHHIHHLKPRIPNYNLKPCHDFVPELQEVKAITFFKSLKSLFLHLWDEDTGKMIGFRNLSRLKAN